MALAVFPRLASYVAPPTGWRPNRGHPLLKDMVADYVFGDLGGVRVTTSNAQQDYHLRSIIENAPIMSSQGSSASSYDRLQLPYNGVLVCSTKFDGANTHYNGGPGGFAGGTSVDMGGLKNFSVATWVYPTNASGGVNSTLVGIHGGPSGDQYLITFDSDNKFHFYVNIGGAENPVSSTSSPSNNTWYLIVGTVDSNASAQRMTIWSGGTLWFDSTISCSGTVAGAPAGVNFSIGCWANGARIFNGYLPRTTLWKRTLSQGEIQQLYVNPFVMYQRSMQNRRWMVGTPSGGGGGGGNAMYYNTQVVG